MLLVQNATSVNVYRGDISANKYKNETSVLKINSFFH